MMWNAIERFSSQGIQFVLTIMIARVLSPGDYGLVAMIGIFMSVAQTIVDSGFSSALIQKEDRTEADYSTMFYSNIAASVVLYLFLFASAPWIADFYNQPALAKIVRVFGLWLILNSFGAIQATRLTIALDFKKLAFATLLSVVIGGSVGILMAYHGYGVWTLVFQTMLANFTWVITLCVLTKWFPQWCFSWSSFRILFSFGVKLLLSNLLHTLYSNMYSLVIGKFFNASILGFFNRAYTLGQFPVQNFGNIVQKVLYPVQCRYQNDELKFNKIFILYLRMSSFILFPLMIGLTVLATPTISLLLGNKWLPAVPFLQIISISIMWFPIMQANVLVLDAKGRTDYHLQSEVIKKVIAVLILCFTIPLGIYWVCWGMLIYSWIDILIVIMYSRRLTDVGYKKQFEILFPTLFLSLCMGGIVHLAVYGIESFILKLIIGGIAGFVFYALFAYLLKFSEIRLLLLFLKNRENGFNNI